jgi:inosose dehydratase
MMKVTIATAPCSWGVWYKDGTPSGTPYSTFLDQAAEAGYTALELGPVGYLPTYAEKLSEELAKRSLSVCAGTACYNLMKAGSLSNLRGELDSLCRLLANFKTPYLVAMDASDVGYLSEKKKYMSPEERLKYINIIKDISKLSFEDYGIKLVYHPHIKTLIETESEIDELLDKAGVDLCFDTGHHAYANGGFEKGEKFTLDFMLKYAKRIAYLHFKNVDGSIMKRVEAEKLDASQAFDMSVMCDLKDGIIDFVELKKVLEKINFDGIAVIEQDMPRATTEQAFATAKRNLQYLRDISII